MEPSNVSRMIGSWSINTRHWATAHTGDTPPVLGLKWWKTARRPDLNRCFSPADGVAALVLRTQYLPASDKRGEKQREKRCKQASPEKPEVSLWARRREVRRDADRLVEATPPCFLNPEPLLLAKPAK